jgi:hypothetical protein
MRRKSGSIASEYWTKIPVNFPFVELDEFIIMPGSHSWNFAV